MCKCFMVSPTPALLFLRPHLLPDHRQHPQALCELDCLSGTQSTMPDVSPEASGVVAFPPFLLSVCNPRSSEACPPAVFPHSSSGTLPSAFSLVFASFESLRSLPGSLSLVSSWPQLG